MQEAADYLAALNPSQLAAVKHDGSSLLILAGAGSGKTRVITTKIAYLIKEKHIDPYAVLAVTFTKKAANEMKERAVALEPRAEYAQIRTFHSWGAYFLRAHAEAAGISKNFTVYDDDDMVTLLGKAVPSLSRQQAALAAHKISLAKDYCCTPDSERLCTISDDPQFADIYAAYEKRLRETGNVDFGDLIMLPYLVLRDNGALRHAMHLRYRVIMVDEYQDSNVAQYLLLQQLAGVEESSGTYVCVVGDDDQSIYRFRGAEVQNILNFQNQFPGTDVIRLEMNYRSTSEILACADSVVRHNGGRLGKTLVAARGKGKLPTLVFLPTQDDETQFCAEIIAQAYQNGTPYSEWAILYRTNAQSLGFETEFLHRKIPYTIVGSLKFYEREEIKDALAWISFVANPRDEVAFRRIVNKPVRGIGAVSQDKVVAAGAGVSLLAGCRNVKLSKKAQEGIQAFCALAEEFTAMLGESVPAAVMPAAAMPAAGTAVAETSAADGATGNAAPEEYAAAAGNPAPAASGAKLAEFVEAVIRKSGLEEFHKSQDDVSGTQKLSNLQELVNSAVLYPCTRQGLLDFLDHIQLDRTLETEDSAVPRDSVTLITLHNTKGLEFPRVIITGMESGIFPRDDKTGGELEEERRLFYVGITRAKNELYLTSCGLRRLYGRTNFMQPSPFLAEIGAGRLRVLGQKPSSFGSERAGDEDPLARRYRKGTGIYHDDYGHGQVIGTETSPDGELVIRVSFESGGIKKFLPKYQEKSLMIED